MNVDKYYVSYTDKWHLMKKYAHSDISLMADYDKKNIMEIYNNIQNGVYCNEEALFKDIYSRYVDRKIFTV